MFVTVGSRLYKPNPYSILYACLIYQGRILTSSDNGTTWSTSLVSFGGRTYLIDLINNIFLVTSPEGSIIYSEDGNSWYYECMACRMVSPEITLNQLGVLKCLIKETGRKDTSWMAFEKVM